MGGRPTIVVMNHLIGSCVLAFLSLGYLAQAEEAKESIPVITPADAAGHEGKYVTVRGTVDGQRNSQKGISYLNFGGRYPNQLFTCLLKPKNFPDGAPALDGKTVEVTGAIHLHEGKPSMDLQGPDKIKVIEAETAAPAPAP